MSAAGNFVLQRAIRETRPRRRPFCASRYSWAVEIAVGALIIAIFTWGVLS